MRLRVAKKVAGYGWDKPIGWREAKRKVRAMVRVRDREKWWPRVWRQPQFWLAT